MPKTVRLTGTERASKALELRRLYEDGASVRRLAEFERRSYGGVHALLAESGVAMRPRGGDRFTKTRA